MPKGVEHLGKVALRQYDAREVPLAVMPKGVEHPRKTKTGVETPAMFPWP